MGRVFLDHIGGSRLFTCNSCDTVLTNKYHECLVISSLWLTGCKLSRNELISTRFTGATGRAFLFNKVINVFSYFEIRSFRNKFLLEMNFFWILDPGYSIHSTQYSIHRSVHVSSVHVFKNTPRKIYILNPKRYKTSYRSLNPGYSVLKHINY